MGGGTSHRSATRPIEVAFAALVAALCMAVNALAVAYFEPLSRENLGPLALSYHHVHPPLIMLPLLLLLLLLCPALRGAGRAALVVFVGAACANVISPLFWDAGVPDYIVFRDIDVIANVSDILMIASAAIVVASIGRRLWQRYASRR